MNGIIKRMKEKTKTIVYYGGKIKARIKDCAVLLQVHIYFVNS